MTTLATGSVILDKTRELCQAILEQPEYQDIRRHVDTFMADDTAKEQYQQLTEKGEYLQYKQQQGMTLTPEEVSEFETQRDALLSNPVARGFLDAQQEMHKIQESVTQLVGKTFELGRVPEQSDLESGSCGSGCGCH